MKTKLLCLSVLVTASLSLTSCATLSSEECLVADWHSIGYRDGVNGKSPDYLMEHSKACLKTNVAPNQRVWEQGRQQGLKKYCTVDNAFSLGMNNRSLNLVCPNYIMSELTQANRRGKNIYSLTEQIEKDERQIKKLEKQLAKLRSGDNLDFKTEREARRYMLSLPAQIKRLNRQINSNYRKITRLRGY